MSAEELIRLLPKLLREHPELRHEVAVILSESMADKGDIAAILEHIEKLREDFNRKVEEDNKRFEGIIAEIKTLREQFNRKVEEDNKRFEGIIAEIKTLREQFNRKVEEDNKRFEGIIAEIKTLREQFNTLASEFLIFKDRVNKLRDKVNKLEENFGAFVESYYTTKVVEILGERLGSTSLKIIKNVAVRGGELDAVIITDGTVYTLEVSGVLRKRDIDKLKRSSDRLAENEEYAGKQIRPVAAGVRIDSHAVELAKHLGVEVIYI